MAIRATTGPALTLQAVQALRNADPARSFSGLNVTPEAYAWLATNRPLRAATPVTGVDPEAVFGEIGAIPKGTADGTPAAPGGPSFDGGGGSGSGAAARAPYDPNADPSFQALLASLGVQENTARTNAQGQIDIANQSLASLLPRIALAGTQQRLGVNNNFEARGVARSGERLRQLALERAGEQQRVGAAQQATAGQIGTVNQNLANQIAALASQRASALVDAQARNA